MPSNRPGHLRTPAAVRPPPPEATPGFLARWVAAQAILDALMRGRPLEERFGSDNDPKILGLDARDRALARSIATVAMRRLGTIRKALGCFLEKGLPRKGGPLEGVLIAGAAQLMFLDVSDHAAVDLAVRAARNDPASSPFAGLVNAVLRNIARAKAELAEAGDPLDDDTPAWLARRWRATYGEATARAIARAHRNEPTLDLTVKSDPEGWAARLGGRALPTGSVRLDTHQPIRELEGYEAGEWWVQDAAAALPARLAPVSAATRALDLCAAPGGKCAELALAGAHVVAVDRSAERLKRVAANLARLRLSADVVVADALAFSAPPFDVTLLDAPCSATGTIRRHPDIAWTKRLSDVTALAKAESDMLARAVALTKPGGTLIFCTCSLEPEEGEDQIAQLMRRDPSLSRVPIEASEIGGLAECVTAAGDLRTLPCHLQTDTPRQSGLDGFFAARLQRRA
ncbi:MAG: RsmB/NOP family class I SAM-dependent RNA methyltransferase [Roseiarcus sp.]